MVPIITRFLTAQQASIQRRNFFRQSKACSHPILDAAAVEKCESLSAGMKEFIAELHQRGLENGL
jgi:hypothetical protein